MVDMEVSRDELPRYAADFIAGLPEPEDGACIVGLKGQLGAGKTTFVQEVAKVLGVSTSVTSPTFVIAQRYPVTHPHFQELIHIDAYRLSPEDKDTIGWREYAKNPKALVLVEWPERLKWFPESAPQLSFEVSGEESREISEI